jgi:hypothetical protein
LDILTPTQEKREKNPNKLSNKQAAPESRGEALPIQSVNKQAGRRKKAGWHLPSNLGEGKAYNSGCPVESSTGVGGKGHLPT